jgi:hypothetical protein
MKVLKRLPSDIRIPKSIEDAKLVKMQNNPKRQIESSLRGQATEIVGIWQVDQKDGKLRQLWSRIG